MTIGDKIKKIRTFRKMTQAELGGVKKGRIALPNTKPITEFQKKNW